MKTEIIRDNAKLPRKAHPTDAGFDVSLSGTEPVTLDWHQPRAVVPLGIRIHVPEFTPGVVVSDTDRGDRGHGSTGV